MSDKKIGGDRVKQETIEVNQIWKRGRSGTHFLIAWIGYDHDPIRVSTFTVETRRTQRMNLSDLLSKKNNRYICVAHLPACKVCTRHPHIRYGKVNGENLYHTACDCLEFDAVSEDLVKTVRAWKANTKYLSTTARSRHTLQVRIRA